MFRFQVLYVIYRQQALGIVQLSTGGDDDMGTLLGLLHTAAPTALRPKTAILKVSGDCYNTLCC